MLKVTILSSISKFCIVRASSKSQVMLTFPFPYNSSLIRPFNSPSVLLLTYVNSICDFRIHIVNSIQNIIQFSYNTEFKFLILIFQYKQDPTLIFLNFKLTDYFLYSMYNNKRIVYIFIVCL